MRMITEHAPRKDDNAAVYALAPIQLSNEVQLVGYKIVHYKTITTNEKDQNGKPKQKQVVDTRYPITYSPKVQQYQDKNAIASLSRQLVKQQMTIMGLAKKVNNLKGADK